MSRERYVDAGELAAIMGVSVSTIKRMVAAGMPSETWGMARTRRFLPSAAIAWARTRETTDAPSAERSTVEVSTKQPDRRTNAVPGLRPSGT